MINKLKCSLFTNKKYIDCLTSLPNREQLLIDIKSHNKTLFLINIDGFKEINEFYGNEFGNFILKEIATELFKLLNSNLNKKIFKFYKLQADEYAILLLKHIQEEQILNLAKKINYFFEEKLFEKDGLKLYISVSIGIGNTNELDHISYKLLSNTTLALKKAKEEKKDYIFYNKEFDKHKEYEETLKWTKKIKEAIKENRIKSFYQPIYDIKQNKIDKYESLIRLIDDNGEIISPYIFLDISKKYRLYFQLTKIVIENTFKEIDKKTNREISINLSTQDIINLEMREFIYENLSKIKNPENVVFEILESEKVTDYEVCLEFIKNVKKLGVKIAIDDFGSGFSNFDYILKLNVDYLKIDGSLIKNINKDKNSKIIIETIISFCKKMNIKTVAEFVSSEEIYNELKLLDIDYVQGYYIGKPESEIK
jgi:diguanylate cyclase (GGDEF)-like protein